MSHNREPQNCPSLAQLRKLLTEDDVDEQLEHHVDGCADCHAALERVTSDQTSDRWRNLISTPPSAGRIERSSELDLLDSQQRHTACFPPSIPGYEIIGELGRGGMGVVYEANERALRRRVAIKTLIGGYFSSPEHLQRFRREAEALASLTHPNIIRIHRCDDVQGLPFLVLEFVEGITLEAWLATRKLTVDQTVELMRQLAQAVHAAHEKGIIHRDLKPANVLLDTTIPNTDFQAKIADFGLARFAMAAAETHSNVMVGTPTYMAPEQLESKDHIGRAVDIYSLGVIFYELLCERPPFRASSTMDLIRMVIDQEPVPPRSLDASIPRDLETICLKCTAKSPAKRYATATDLDQDLQRWQQHYAIHAKPATNLEKLSRWAQRNRALAVTLAVFAAFFVGTLAVITSMWAKSVRINHELTVSMSELEASSYLNGIVTASQAIGSNNVSLATEILEQLPAEPRNWEWYYLRGLCNQAVATLTLSGDEITDVACAPNARFYVYADASGKLLAHDADNHTLIWDTQLDTAANDLCFTCDGNMLVAGCDDGTIRCWTVESWERSGTFNASPCIADVTPHPSNPLEIAFASEAGVGLIDLASGNTLRSDQRVPVVAIGFDNTGKEWLCGVKGGLLASWSDAHREGELLTQTGNISLQALAVSRRNDAVYCVGHEPFWRRYDGPDYKESLKARYSAGINDCALVNDEALFVTAGRDGAIALWDTSTGDQLRLLRGHQGPVTSVIWDSVRELLVTGGADGTVRTWSLNTSAYGTQFSVPAEITCLEQDSHRRRIFLGCVDQRVYAVNQEGQCEYVIDVEHRGSDITCIRVSADGRWLVVGMGAPSNSQAKNRVVVYDLRTFQVVGSIDHLELGGPPGGMVITADGRFLYVRSSSSTILEWDLEQCKTVGELGQSPGPVRTIQLSSDSRWLLAKTDHSRIACWDRHTKRMVFEVNVLGAKITRMRIAPDDTSIAVGCRDGQTRIYSIPDGTLIQTLASGQHIVGHLEFTRDGTRLFCGHADGTLNVWDLQAGRRLCSLRMGSAAIKGIAMYGSGTVFVAGGETNSVTLLERSNKE